MAHAEQLNKWRIRTVSTRIAFAVVGPMPKMYCREYSMRFWLGMSTPATRAACILSGARCRMLWCENKLTV